MGLCGETYKLISNWEHWQDILEVTIARKVLPSMMLKAFEKYLDQTKSKI
jgi:hypothetical protein